MPPPQRNPNFQIGSSVFRVGDRQVDTYETDYRTFYHAHPLERKEASSSSSLPAATVANRSNLPFLDKNVPLTTDSRDFYKHHGAAYLPENMSKASTTDSQHTDIAFGYERDPLSTVSRDAYTVPPLAKRKTREEAMAEIQVTRSGVAIVRSLSGAPPTYLSTMEAGNRGMLQAPAQTAVPAAGGAPDAPLASEIAKIVSVQLGTSTLPISTDYRDHFGDLRAGRPPSASPYLYENRVHEVDPSNMGANPHSASAAKAAAASVGAPGSATLRVLAPDGTSRVVPCVKSAIDFGHQDNDGRSVYMTDSKASRVYLTRIGGWHTHTVPFVPVIRPKYAANASHPAVALMKEAAERAREQGL
jgi:hypothetical protein